MFKKLIQIENNPEILQYRFQFDDTLMWPFIRFEIFLSAMEQQYGLNAKKREKIKFLSCIKYLLLTYLNNPYRCRNSLNKKIIIFSSGITNVFDNGKYFNRISDYFAVAFGEETLIIEDYCLRKFLRPRSFGCIKYHDYIDLLVIAKSKFKKPSKEDKLRISQFVAFLKLNICCKFNNKFWTRIELRLQKISKRLVDYNKFYNKLFDFYRPKLIFLEDACSGGRAYIMKIAKKRGIETAELQHGLICKNHITYNFGQAICKAGSYKEYLPDYFLMWGDYWNDKCCMPVKKTIIGNPYLTEKVGNIKKNLEKKQILFTSSFANAENFIRFVKKAIARISCNNYEIIVRPHPMEQNVAEARYGCLRKHGVQIDNLEFSLIDRLLKCDVVIGDASTGLYEAAALDLPVCVIYSDYAEKLIDLSLFTIAKNANDVINFINFPKKITVNRDLLFDPAWKNKYHEFVMNIIGE